MTRSPKPSRLRVTMKQLAFIKSCLDERRFIEACLGIKNNSRGYVTPDREFLGYLLRSYEHRGSITPAEVKDQLQEFESSLEDAVADAADTVRRFKSQVVEALLPDYNLVLLPGPAKGAASILEEKPEGGAK